MWTYKSWRYEQNSPLRELKRKIFKCKSPSNRIERQNAENQKTIDPNTTKPILTQENEINVEVRDAFNRF